MKQFENCSKHLYFNLKIYKVPSIIQLNPLSCYNHSKKKALAICRICGIPLCLKCLNNPISHGKHGRMTYNEAVDLIKIKLGYLPSIEWQEEILKRILIDIPKIKKRIKEIKENYLKEYKEHKNNLEILISNLQNNSLMKTNKELQNSSQKTIELSYLELKKKKMKILKKIKKDIEVKELKIILKKMNDFGVIVQDKMIFNNLEKNENLIYFLIKLRPPPRYIENKIIYVATNNSIFKFPDPLWKKKEIEIQFKKEISILNDWEIKNKSDYYLLKSSEKGLIRIVKYLIEKGGVKLDIRKKGVINFNETPLHLASMFGHLEIVKFLIKKGAKIDIKNNFNHTPLHLASIEGHLEIVKFLIKKGAKIDILGICAFTPLYYASYYGHFEIEKFLIEKGAHQINFQFPLHYLEEVEKLK